MFHKEWRDIRSYEQDTIKYQRLKYQNEEPLTYLSGLHPDLIIRDGVLLFNKPDPFSIKLKDIRVLVIKPSVFVGNVLSGNILHDKVTITLNLNFNQVKTEEKIAPAMANLLMILADPTRMRIIKILWNYDATTKELAEITGLSPATISLHLKQMREADLVMTRKFKKYVYYQLRKDRFYGMERKLIRYFYY